MLFFAELVREIHARGMKVILDGVFNHCGSFNKWLDRGKNLSRKRRLRGRCIFVEREPLPQFLRFPG